MPTPGVYTSAITSSAAPSASQSRTTPEQIAARRRALGLSATRLALMLRMGQGAIIRYEEGWKGMSPARQARLNAALEILEDADAQVRRRLESILPEKSSTRTTPTGSGAGR